MPSAEDVRREELRRQEQVFSPAEAYKKLNTLQVLVTAGLLFLVAFVISMTALMVYTAYRSGSNSQQLKQVATETHASLCALKLDIELRVEDTQKLLDALPRGAEELFGIPVDVIERGQRDRMSTLSSLSGLNCEE